MNNLPILLSESRLTIVITMQILRKHLPFLLALAAFLGCVLACRPGFSPDGRRVLFSVFDEETQRTLLRVYDRKTEETKTLREISWPESNAVYCAASWSPSGAQLGFVWVPEKGTNLNIEILDAKSGRQIRSAFIASGGDSSGALVHPPAFAGQFLLFGGKALTRYNLRTGQIDHENVATDDGRDGIYVFNSQKDVRYYANPPGSNSADMIEFGTIDVRQMKRVPEQSFQSSDFEGIPGVSRGGKRIAIGKKPPSGTIQIWHRSKLEKTLPLTDTNFVMGNLTWSVDEKFILAPAFRDRDEPSSDMKGEMFFLEIPLDGSPLRQTSLGQLKMKADEAMSSCQAALSPDGKTVAIGTPFGSFNGSSPKSVMLLIDLNDPKRTVKRVACHQETLK
jgi:hypothetical protein